MSKKILTVGVDLALDDVETEDFDSRASLLDWDIVLFKPIIDSFVSYAERYRGKPSLSDSVSFQVKEACEHWRREIKQAVESGKTVIAFLPSLSEVYIDTGNRTYSGTGRNRATTRLLEPFDNYRALPVDLKPTNSVGSGVKLAGKSADILTSYWNEFSEYSEYQVLLNNPDLVPALVTRTGDKVVGAVVRSKLSSGALVCLPDMDFIRNDFLSSDEEDDEGAPAWTEEARKFAGRLISAVVALDKAIHADAEVTPEPSWAAEPQFSLSAETDLRRRLLAIEAELETIQRSKEKISSDLKDAGTLRHLLYEKGKPLERVIIEALKHMGFEARPFKEDASEFDVVFQSAEGRLLGEAEGKDSKPINVDKLRQLAMNIHEDLQREEVSSPAKAVLFGNAHRLTAPAERLPEAFTEKCVLAAKANGTALISTLDLFRAAQYLSSGSDAEYARACRTAILNGTGVTVLPDPPASLGDTAPQAVEEVDVKQSE